MPKNKPISLVISIDVEEDMPYWKAEEEATVRNIGSIPRLQGLFDRYSIKPTYLLTYPVASEKDSVSTLTPILEAGRCEIGAHLHPWTTPPIGPGEKEGLIVPSALSENMLREKLTNLTWRIRESFGASPVSYRAGRFGFDSRSAVCLAGLGYLVDSSVTPLVSWKNINGPSYLYDRVEPHFLDEKYGIKDLSSLLEVPTTIALTRDIKGVFKRLYLNIPRFTKIRGLLGRNHLNIIDMLWLYPTLYSAEEMMLLSDILIGRGCTVLNMFFHSSEARAGESIYHKTEEEIKDFFSKLESYFNYLFSNYPVTGRTLSEFRNHFIGGKT